MNFYWKVGLAMGAVIVIAITAIVLLPRSDEKEIEAVIEQGIEAARRGDTEGVIELISRNYGGAPEEYAEVCTTIRQYVGPGKYSKLEYSELEIRVFGDTASARFKIKVIGLKSMPDFPRWVELDFRKEPAGWRVTRAKSDPVK